MNKVTNVACAVLSQGLQGWGQSVDDQIRAWQGAFDFMKLSVTLSVGENGIRKVFVYDGPDADKAKAFMDEVRGKFPLGQFEAEQAMIEECLKHHANA